jgi:transposase
MEETMQAYSQDIRERVLRALERDEGVSAIAMRFEVSRWWVQEVRKQYKTHGRRSSLPIGGHRKSRLAGWEETIQGWLKEQADLTLAQMCERLAEQGVTIKVPALWHQLNKWGLTLKKNSARQRARTRRRAGGAAGMEGKSVRP